MLLGGEGGVAEHTLVDLLRVVGHLVELQDVVVAEGLAADVAAVGLFFGVSPFVDLELLEDLEDFEPLGDFELLVDFEVLEDEVVVELLEVLEVVLALVDLA